MIGEGERLVQIAAAIIVDADSDEEASAKGAVILGRALKNERAVMSTVYVMNGSVMDTDWPPLIE